MNAVLQALFSVIRSTLHNCQYSSNTEGVIAKTLCSAAMATSASGEVGKLKSLLAQYSSFYSGFTQEDASECLFMLLGIINQGKKDTEHIGSSKFLQPPQYLIIIVNRFGNNGTTKK